MSKEMNIITRARDFLTKNFNNVSGFFFAGGGDLGVESWSRTTALSMQEKSLYATAAIHKRGEKTGQVQFILRDANGEDVVDTKETRAWLTLLERPNGYHTAPQFWGLAQRYYDVIGACFIHKVYSDGTVFRTGIVPDRLEILRADRVSIVTDIAQQNILRFDYFDGTQITQINPEDMIYWHRPSLRNPLIGESLIASAAATIESEYHISAYHATVLKNGGRLETLFSIANVTTKEQLKQLEDGYKEKYADAKKSGTPMFMSGDVKNITTALSPSELAYLETKTSNYRDLAIVTGVPKEVLANTDGSTYQNADAAIRIFLRETVKPNVEGLVRVLDWRLIPAEYTLDFIDVTPSDADERRKDLETADKVGAMTTNEKRAALGMDPIAVAEADMIFVPFTLRPLGAAEASAAPAEKSHDEHPLRDPITRKVWGKAVDARRTNYDRTMLRATRKFFADQEKRVIESLGRKRKIAVDEIFNDGLETSLANATLVQVIREIFREQGQYVADTFGLGTFSMTQAVERSLRERAELFTQSIIATQKEKLSAEMVASFAAKETRAELVSRINAVYADVSQGWAEVIARTEVHAATSGSTMHAYEQGGMKIKIWTAVMDGRTRRQHAEMDGEERGIHEEFSNGLMYPSEPNCRCVI
jgi:HK97 family phage portal protein